MFWGQIPKPSLQRDKKLHDRTDILIQKWDWTALPHITTYIPPTGKESFLFYLSYSNTRSLGIDFYSRHITVLTTEKSNPCSYSQKAKAYHQATSADLFKCQRCQLPTFTHLSFYREMASSISLCYWKHLCLLSQTKHEKSWRTLNTTSHQLSQVLVTKTNTSWSSANWTLSEPHLYPVTRY